MPLSSGFLAPRLFSDRARAAKPIPTSAQATSTAPGLATPASCPVMANTPEPMQELTTMPISPNRPIPLAFSLMISLLSRNQLFGFAPGLRLFSRTYRTCLRWRISCLQAQTERRGETDGKLRAARRFASCPKGRPIDPAASPMKTISPRARPACSCSAGRHGRGTARPRGSR